MTQLGLYFSMYAIGVS